MRLPVLLFFWATALVATAQNANVVFRSKITYPGQSLANVWGYAAGGHEYALAGGRAGLIIVDVTNPDNPVQISQIPGPNNLWKEIKTYRHYAYVTSEGGQGVQIVDLSTLPAPPTNVHHYTGDGAIANQLNRIHALHIDTTKGFLYAYGSNLFGGGPVVLNLEPDPYNPTFAGSFSQLGYVHDGYTDNDTLYSGHIYNGQFAIVDMHDKSNPVVINTQNTPGNFTHNTWLSTDRKVLFTTDEVANSVLAAYDISDPANIRFLDDVQSNPGSGSIVHNTHILGDFAVSSYYRDGFTIVDVSRPDNLVQVGNFDTYVGGGNGFNGCWGVYPFFPSGTIVASNISSAGTSDGELWITTPTYVHASHLEGRVLDAATGLPLPGAFVEVTGASPALNQTVGPDGVFKLGTVQTGSVGIQASLAGYLPESEPVQLQPGSLFARDIELFPNGQVTVSGDVRRLTDSKPMANALVRLHGSHGDFSTETDNNGFFSVPNVLPGYYTIQAFALKNGQAEVSRFKVVSDTSLQLWVKPPTKVVRNTLPTLRTWPNPFQNKTVADYVLPEHTDAQLEVFDQWGRLLESRLLPGGTGAVTLGDTLPPGTYFMRISGKDIDTETSRLVKIP